MKTVHTISGNALSPIGIGTYGIGGRGHRDVDLRDLKEETIYIKALKEQLQLGYNFSELSMGYGHGNSARLFAQSLKESGLHRNTLFLTNSIYPRDFPDFETLEKDVCAMYELFGTATFDSTLVTQSLVVRFGYERVVAYLRGLLEQGKTRYVSLSNSNKALIKRFKLEFGDKLFAHETHISFEIRLCQDEGIFELCDALDIQSIIWRPLRQGRTASHNWKPLVDLSHKYNKTQNQIVLNWMKSLGLMPEVFSTSSAHIKENWDAMTFMMEQEDVDLLTNYRIPGYTPPTINWDNMGNGDSIVPPVMGFETDYKG